MALSNTTVKQTYNGDDATVDFAIPHDIMEDDSAETVVYIRDISDTNAIAQTLQVEGALQDYQLTGASPPGTPFDTTVTFNSAPTSDEQVIVIRALARTQDLDLDESGDFPAETFEQKLDNAVAMIQSLKEELDRIPKLRVTEQFGDTTLDQPFANYLIATNDDNDGFEFVSPSSVASAEAAWTAQVAATIINSQTSTNVTGMSLAVATFSSAVAFCELTRGSNGGHLALSIRRINSAWVVKEIWANTDVAHGLTWNITSGGQVQYSSGTEGVGELLHRMLRFTV